MLCQNPADHGIKADQQRLECHNAVFLNGKCFCIWTDPGLARRMGEEGGSTKISTPERKNAKFQKHWCPPGELAVKLILCIK